MVAIGTGRRFYYGCEVFFPKQEEGSGSFPPGYCSEAHKWLPSEPPWGRAGGPWGSWWVGPREPEQVGRRAVRMLCEDVSGLFYVQSSTGPRWSCPAGPTLQNG